jgi:serine/threonine-protein kinase
MRLTDDALTARTATPIPKPIQSIPMARLIVLVAWSIFAGLYIVYLSQFSWLGVFRLREVVCQPLMPGDLTHLLDLCVLGVFIPEGIAHLVMITSSVFMIMRQKREWLAAFSAVALLFVSAGFSTITFAVSNIAELAWIGRLLLSLSSWMAIVFVITFPDGRFSPRWTIWLVGMYTIWITAWWFVPALDISQGLTSISFFAGLIAISPLTVATWLRARHILTSEQRQQLRLVTAAGIYSNLLYWGALLITLFVRVALLQSAGGLLIFILAAWGRWAAVALIPIAILISIVRFQLFDVDRVIGRGLLVIAITLLLAIVFGSLVVAVQQAAFIMTGDTQSNLAVVLAALGIALIFQPIRQRLQRLIDSRYFASYNAPPTAEVSDEPAPAVEPPPNTPISLRERAEKNGALSGALLGPYALNDLLGRGGMAEVYCARHNTLRRDAAIKILSPHLANDPQFRERFAREGRMLSELAHPHIVNVYDAGEEEGVYYIAMQLIDGETLAALLTREGALPHDRALPILKAIASALDHAHARGVIHRDVKPHNILIGRSQDGALLHPYLTDFGIARMIGANTILTQGTSMMGTLDYAAPEQIAGLEDADHRADIYALGTVAYLMLSGRLPFHEAHAGALIFSLLRQPPPDPRTLNADIPAHVALALLRALAKEPDERYDSAGAFVQALA